MNKYALTVENLTKVYSDSKNKKENKALNDLNFQVKQGEIFGLLGPNGAGKTTFLSILGGTVSKTNGSINVWGFNLDENPRQVRPCLFNDLTFSHRFFLSSTSTPAVGSSKIKIGG